jgi:hypothetical protein
MMGDPKVEFKDTESALGWPDDHLEQLEGMPVFHDYDEIQNLDGLPVEKYYDEYDGEK